MPEDDSNAPSTAAAKGWDGFAADPRTPENANYRASDSDRQHGFELLAEAYSDGRLGHEEYEQRLDDAMKARMLGDFPPLVADLLVPRRRFLPAAQHHVSSQSLEVEAKRAGRKAWMGWIGLAMLFNLIWFATVIGTGTFQYWWPFWPMLGTAIPTFLAAQAARHRALRLEPQPLYPAGRVPPGLVPPPVLGDQRPRPGFGFSMPPPPGLTAEQRMRWRHSQQQELRKRQPPPPGF